jgi:hypothetical protein
MAGPLILIGMTVPFWAYLWITRRKRQGHRAAE